MSARTKKIILAMIIIVSLGGLGFYLFYEPSYEDVTYKEFTKLVSEGRVESVTFDGDDVLFELENSNYTFRTDNPETPDFKEKLLLKGIEIENASNGTDILYFVMDIIFDLVFVAFLVGAIVFYKTKIGNNFKVTHRTKVSFSDIAGMENVKCEMAAIVDALKNPGKWKEKGVRPVKGVILEGPPGNGKTLFAKALATQAGVNFIATKGADFQSAFMSVGSLKIKNLFKKARKHKPCIIFIDEFDGIGERRNYAGTGIDKENNRIITALLNEMDGFHELSGVLVIAATNSFASLDKALVRPGRFDIKIRVPNPNKSTVLELIDIYTKDKKLDPSIDKDALSYEFKGMNCAAIEASLNDASMKARMAGRDIISKEDIENAIKMVLRESEN